MSVDASLNSGLVSRFEQLAADRAEHVAIEDDRERVTFGELSMHAHRVARALTDRGLQGKRVAMLVTQSARWVETFYGIALASGVIVPLSHLHPENEQRYFVEAAGAEVLIVSDELKGNVSGYSSGRAVLSIDELRSAGEPGARAPSRDDDVALILYTSGTTGKPKGALITHGNLASLGELVGRAWAWTVDDVLLHALPLHHLHGLGISLLVSLTAGGKSRMLERFDSDRMWEEMGRSTVLMGVPTMHKKLLDAFDSAPAATQARWRAHAAGLRLLTSGSAALPASVAERWRSLTGNYPLERFGMTEIGVGTSNPLDGERRPGTCGLPLPGMEIRIVTEDGSDAPPGEPGEIWIKGPSVFKGYDANPQATREAFVDGWFRSGDTACWDDGYVKILGSDLDRHSEEWWLQAECARNRGARQRTCWNRRRGGGRLARRDLGRDRGGCRSFTRRRRARRASIAGLGEASHRFLQGPEARRRPPRFSAKSRGKGAEARAQTAALGKARLSGAETVEIRGPAHNGRGAGLGSPRGVWGQSPHHDEPARPAPAFARRAMVTRRDRRAKPLVTTKFDANTMQSSIAYVPS